jgi:hypothetical protein
MGSESDAENPPAEPKTDTEAVKPPADSETADAPEKADAPAPETADVDAPASAPAPAVDSPARKKRKKKKKRAESVEAEAPRPRGPTYAADGSERPAFLLDFPEDAELAKLTAAFEAGNYRYVREHGPDVAERTEDPAVRRAATELLARIEPDPLIRFVLGFSVVLLLFLTYYAYANHGH